MGTTKPGLLNFLPQTLDRAVLNYYKKYAHSIFSSPPIPCDPNSEFEVHTLVCRQHVLQSLWSLKTFFYFSGQRPALFVHADGSLNSDLRKNYQDHFPGCIVIEKKQASDVVRSKLADYEFCSKYRFECKYSTVMKLFDPVFFSRTNKLLMMDSDILFFKKPQEILDCIASNKGCFMADYQNSYALPVARLDKLFNMEVFRHFNAGLTYLPAKECFDLDLVEHFLKVAHENKVNFAKNHALEQTVWALLASKQRERFMRLPETYQISKQPLTECTISHHYVNDGSRKNLYKKGVRYFKKKHFYQSLLSLG